MWKCEKKVQKVQVFWSIYQCSIPDFTHQKSPPLNGKWIWLNNFYRKALHGFCHSPIHAHTHKPMAARFGVQCLGQDTEKGKHTNIVHTLIIQPSLSKTYFLLGVSETSWQLSLLSGCCSFRRSLKVEPVTNSSRRDEFLQWCVHRRHG